MAKMNRVFRSTKNKNTLNDLKVQNPDYHVAQYEGRLFFKNENFTIEVKDLKFTVPPEKWVENGYGIISFTYDIYHGDEYINQTEKSDFEELVGSWIKEELTGDDNG